MKIAVVTDDGQSISTHFGRARSYAVLTVRDGGVVERELRPKLAPHLDPQAAHDDTDKTHDGPAAHARHDQMIASIADCACLIAGGMGRGAYDRISAAGIRPVVTDLRVPDEAAIACAEGRLENLLDRLH
jgi:predicted Fe-Mo cluster-binding NifX family protein